MGRKMPFRKQTVGWMREKEEIHLPKSSSESKIVDSPFLHQDKRDASGNECIRMEDLCKNGEKGEEWLENTELLSGLRGEILTPLTQNCNLRADDKPMCVSIRSAFGLLQEQQCHLSMQMASSGTSKRACGVLCVGVLKCHLLPSKSNCKQDEALRNGACGVLCVGVLKCRLLPSKSNCKQDEALRNGACGVLCVGVLKCRLLPSKSNCKQDEALRNGACGVLCVGVLKCRLLPSKSNCKQDEALRNG
ncbi:Mage-like protein 2 [Columba livia]|nr:Mage-like protein 2 [Columba livia]